MGRTVVIVDDHEQFRRSARKLLELEGFDVVGEAATGSDGIAEVERLRPALALVDVALPDVSGFEVAERVAGTTTVILVSSRGRGEVGRRVERSSALGFVPRTGSPGVRWRRSWTTGETRGGIGLAVAAVLLGIVGYDLRVDNVAFAAGNAAASVAVSWAYVAAGLVAWALRPANRMGPLMVAVGFALLVGALQYSESEWVFTVGFLLGDLDLALFAHAVLAYPSGRILDRAERLFVVVGYVVALGFHTLLLLVFPDPRSPLTVHSDPELFDDLRKTYTVVAYGILAAIFVLLVARRLARATPGPGGCWRRCCSRRWSRPSAPSPSASTFVDVSPSTDDALFWWQFVGRTSSPVRSSPVCSAHGSRTRT